MLQLDENMNTSNSGRGGYIGVEAKGSTLQKGPFLQLKESLKNISSAVGYGLLPGTVLLIITYFILEIFCLSG